MTLDLQQVIADREEGTPGPWVLNEDTRIGPNGWPGYPIWNIEAPGDKMFMGSEVYYPYVPTEVNEARRIARVPELEAFYITHHNAPAVYAAAERLAEIAGKTAKGPEDFAELAEALQELRKAMGKPSDPETLAMIDALGGK